MDKIIILFTSSFPYFGGEQFIETEIEYLSKFFDKIIIVPSKKSNRVRKVPKNVIVDDFVASSNKSIINRATSMFSRVFFENLSWNLFENKYLAIQSYYVKKYMQWLEKFLITANIDACLFYSYWFNAATIALSYTKDKYKNLKFITRAHGGDLYEHVHKFKEFPARKKVIKNINKIFTISNDGKKNLELKYPESQGKIIVSRLGIKKHGFVSLPSKDSIFRIVSCSSIIPVKRVEFIIDILGYLIGKNINIHWTHIGDGKLRSYLEKKASKMLGKNITYTFLGFLQNELVYKFYRDNPVDLFVNVSLSEGIPVSIMEAQSFGIPVMATNVGGTKEIVNNKNGFLINVSLEPKHIANILIDFFSNKEIMLTKRKKSFEMWENHYNADKNYALFCNELYKLFY